MKEKYTIRCHDDTALNYQTAPMSYEAAQRLVEDIEKKQTCTLTHTIHRLKRMSDGPR